jgi:hypothetical protein
MAHSQRFHFSPMTYKEINKQIQEIEEFHNLLQYEVDGWCAWTLIRFEVITLLSALWGKKPHYNYPPWYRIGAMVGQDMIRMTRLHNARCLVATRSSGHSEKRDDKYEDAIFDQMLLELGSYFKIEQINNSDYVFAQKTQLVPRHMTTTGFAVVAALCAHLSLGPKYVARIGRILHRHIVKDLGLEVLSEQDITQRLLNFFWRKKLTSYVLQRIKPQYVLITSPSGFYDIIAAAREQKIRVIEHQHGIIHSEHPDYNWSSYAQKYVSRIPIPDEIWLYGNYWRDVLEATGFWKEKLRVVGSLRMDRYRALAATHDDNICTLVFTTQGYDVEQIVAFLYNFICLISTQLPVRLYIKLHPIFEHNRLIYEQAFHAYPQVEVISGSVEPSTFSLLTKAHFHLSITSTCHFEALALGVPTIILPFTNHELMVHLCDTGYAFLSRTPQELLEIVMQYRTIRVPSEVGDHYFRSNALEHMLRELEQT